MAGYPDSLGERHRYLSIGFFAQGLIMALIEFEGGKTEGLVEKLTDAISVLQGDEQPQAPSGVKAFRTYQGKRTLYEVFDQASVEQILTVLRDLRGQVPAGPSPNSRAKAQKAIHWFARLQNRALRNYGADSEPRPRGVRELCQTR